jgi:kynureninase
VFDFHVRQGLTPQLLRDVSRHQVGLLKTSFEALDVDPAVAGIEPMPDDRRCGFLALRSSRAAELSRALRVRGVSSDFRGDVLRLGPAPYLSDHQLRTAMEALGEALRQPPGH